MPTAKTPSGGKSAAKPAAKRQPTARAACPWTDPGADGAGLELEDFPTFMLNRLSNALQTQAVRVYSEKVGLAPTEWRLLARLSRSAPMNFGDLCRMSFLDKGHVSRTLRDLQERGLVNVEADPSHGRRQIVDITRDGRALVRRAMPVARREQMRLLAELDAGQRKAMYASLRKLLALVGEP